MMSHLSPLPAAGAVVAALKVDDLQLRVLQGAVAVEAEWRPLRDTDIAEVPAKGDDHTIMLS